MLGFNSSILYVYYIIYAHKELTYALDCDFLHLRTSCYNYFKVTKFVYLYI